MGKKYVPLEGTRHILLPKDIIEGNIDKSKMRDDVKQSLISLSKRCRFWCDIYIRFDKSN